jgi:apolipoprotein N-acyltransferase
MRSEQKLVHEGLVAGAIGATGVAAWFLILDVLAGRPLFTPSALGGVLAGHFSSDSSGVHIPWVVGYTLFHFVAFFAVGLILSFVAHRAEREPSILAVFLILFVVFELGFYGFTAILAETRLPGALAWYRVTGGNVIAAVLMGTYIWRGHRALAAEFADALGAHE